MRVLHLVPALFGRQGVFGGAERYVYELARNMAESTTTSLLAFGDEDSRIQDGKLAIRVLGGAWPVRGQSHNSVSLRMLPDLLAADVIHCHQQHILTTTIAGVAGRLTGKRVFVTDLGGGGWDVSAYVSTDRLFRGHLHISGYSRQAFGHAGKPWAHVIYGGVDTVRFQPADSGNPKTSVLFVGRLMPHKGISDLIDALPVDMPLEIIGRPYNEEYTKRLKIQAEGKRVTFRHECSDGDLVRAYADALCVVLPSVYRTSCGQESAVPELLGQTLLEAMASGRPAVCTDVASMPEIVEDGVTGFIVPPNDPRVLGAKLEWLRDHPSEADQMGKAGRQRAERDFTWNQVVRKCLDIYSAD